jgi:hypothetical protein
MEYILLLVIIGMLFYTNSKLNSKIDNLSNTVNTLHNKLNRLLTTGSVKAKPVSTENTSEIPVKPVPIKSIDVEIPIVSEKTVPKSAIIQKKSKPRPEAESKILTKKSIKQVQSTLSLWERFKEKNPDLEKFIGENLINKIGILILVLGISYFVKFAIDKDWINEPARVGIGVLAGSLILVLAHKLQKKYSSFSSVLVAGAIAVFYFTIAIAFHEYKLFNQTVAFIIMVLITAFSCLISLSYNRMELAILSLIGGFSVPFMISTGSGNYVVLFSYIAILDIGILALAYFKKWHLVNTLAFIFTNLLFGGWLLSEINAEGPYYLGALIFAFIFYLIFVITNIINNIKTKGAFSKPQLALLAINSFVFYGFGMLVLSNYHPEFSGLFTAVLAVLNLVYAWVLFKKFGLDKTAVYLLIGLTLTFITLAIPIQFEGNYITLFWAAEGVLLMWLAKKSQIKSYRYASVLVHGLMIISLCIDWVILYKGDDKLVFLFNPIFSTGIFAIACLIVVRFILRSETELLRKLNLVFNPIQYRSFISLMAIILGYFVGIFEIGYQSGIYLGSDTHSLYTFPVLYHLLFTAVLAFFLKRTKILMSLKLSNIIAICNILAYTLLFFKLPFMEQQQNVSLGQGSHISYYIHYLSLSLIVYFGYLIYKTNKQQKIFALANTKLVYWGAAFVFVFLVSSELILQGIQIMNLEVTPVMLAEYTSNFNDTNLYMTKQYFAADLISHAKYKIIKTGLPVLWGVLAFIFLILGIKKQVKELRIIALSLLGITIVKLFTYDISNVSETGKIVAFILLGVLILVISFVYQKIKVLVIDEDKTTKHD